MPQSSTKNSTKIPLDGQKTFVGSYEKYPDDLPFLNILCKSDQDGFVYVDHSSDSLSTDYTDVLKIKKDVGMSECVPFRGNSFRMRITNTSYTAQTYLRCYIFFTQTDTSSRNYTNMRSSYIYSILFDNSIIAETIYSGSTNVKIFNKITIMGHCNGQCSLYVQASIDNTSWYDTQIVFNINNQNYYYTFDFPCGFIRLKAITTNPETIISSHMCAKS